MHGLSRARSTTAAPPHPRLRQASRLSPPHPLRRGRGGNARGGSHVHCCPVDGLDTRLYPCGIANGYAVDIHRGLPTRAEKTRPGVPRPLASRTGTRREPAHIHRVGAGSWSRGVTTPVPLVYLPVSLTGPGPSGSPKRPDSRGCSHLAADPRLGLPPASPHRYDGKAMDGLTPPSGKPAPRGALSGRLFRAASRRTRPCCPGFLSPFGAPAFASWTILFPPGNSASLTVGLSAALVPRPDPGPGFPRSAGTRHDREGWPLYAPGATVSTRPGKCPRPPPAASQRPAPAPRHHDPSAGAHLNEASSRVHSRSPVLWGVRSLPGL